MQLRPNCKTPSKFSWSQGLLRGVIQNFPTLMYFFFFGESPTLMLRARFSDPD